MISMALYKEKGKAQMSERKGLEGFGVHVFVVEDGEEAGLVHKAIGDAPDNALMRGVFICVSENQRVLLCVCVLVVLIPSF